MSYWLAGLLITVGLLDVLVCLFLFTIDLSYAVEISPPLLTDFVSRLSQNRQSP